MTPIPSHEDEPRRDHSDETDASRRKEGEIESQNDARERPPPLSRLVSVAAGLEQWTEDEKAWLARHPEWLESEERLRQAINAHRPDRAQYEKWLNAVLKRRIKDDDTPSIS